MDIDASACRWTNPTVPVRLERHLNNGAGYICACRDGTWVVGWTCDAAERLPRHGRPFMPRGRVGTVDAATGEDAAISTDAGAVDSGEVVDSCGHVDAGGGGVDFRVGESVDSGDRGLGGDRDSRGAYSPWQQDGSIWISTPRPA